MCYEVGKLYRLIGDGEHKIRTDLAPVLCVSVDVLDRTAKFCAPCGNSCGSTDENGNEEYYEFGMTEDIHCVFSARLADPIIGRPLDARAMGGMFVVDHTPLPYVPERWDWWDTDNDTCAWFREDVWAGIKSGDNKQAEED